MNILRNKTAIFSLLTITVIFGIFFSMGALLTNRVNDYVLDLTGKITKKIGHPVTIEKVTTKWDWLFLKVSIKNLTVTDQSAATPLFMASEIVSTVDALDSIRTLGLKFKHLLIRNPRLVMQWNGIDTPTIAGLGHINASGDINPAGVLKLLAMQRRITVENGDFHLQGNEGADLPFMGVKLEFNYRGNNEYTLLARGNVAAAVQPEFVIAANLYGDLQNYAQAMIDFEIKTSNLQLAELFNFIPKYRQELVQGEFEDFDLRGTIQNGTVRNIKSDFNINRITVAKDTVINGGVGHIEFVPGSNHCKFKITHSILTNKLLFTEPINIEAISSNINYKELDPNTIHLIASDAHINFMQIDVHPSLDLEFSDNKLKTLHFNSDLKGASVRKLLVLLPDKKMSPALNAWFDTSLVSGEIDNLKLNYENKNFFWGLRFKNTELKYSKDWPSVHNIDATLNMDADKLSLKAAKAKIMDEPINSLQVDFSSHKNTPYAVVNIKGTMDTTLAKGMAFLQNTPLKQSISKELAVFQPDGAISLDLGLKINVIDPVEPIKVAADVKLNKDTLKAPNLGITLNDITGNIKFTNNSIQSENLRLNVLGQPANAKISMTDNSVMKMSITTLLQIADLQKMLPQLNLNNFTGNAKVMASMDVPWGNKKLDKVINVHSDLVGVSINYPAPFNKAAANKMSLQLQYNAASNGNDNLRIKYAGLLDTLLFLNSNKLNGGHIAINKKLERYEYTDTLQVVGNIKYLDWSQWQSLLKNANDGNTMPIAFNVAIDRLKIDGTEYNALKLKYQSKTKELYIDSPIVTGTIVSNKLANKVVVKLEKLNIPQQTSTNNNKLIDYLQEQRVNNKLPHLQFVCDKLNIKQQVFKNINLELLPHSYGYEINNLSIVNDNIKLQARGRWHMDDNPYTVITGNAYTNNFGKVLASWGYADSMTRGKGELNFSVQWDGAPTAFDLFNLAGNSHVDLRTGNLTNVNPGLGRIIGLLSFETISRRLQLDFSDLISKGFAFDKLVADIKLEPGRLSSENILINSPSAKIEMAGKTSIKSKELDFTMYVTPKVGAGLPIAAALAAGPAVGAAIWLFDKASGSKISELTKYKYLVTGTWDKPKIDETSESNNKAQGFN